MKHFRKTVLNILVVAMTMLVLSPCGAVRAEEPESYDLWVGGIPVTSENKDDILGDGGKAKYDPSSGILTLDSPVLSTELEKAIHAKNLDLIVQGNATLKSSQYGILVEGGSLTIAGGNITVDVKDADDTYGMKAGNTLSIQDGTVTITVKSTGGVLCNPTGLMGGTVQISGGTVTIDITSGYDSMGIVGDTVISGGDITLHSKGIYADGICEGSFTMSDGKLQIESISDDYGCGIRTRWKTIDISGGELIVTCSGSGTLIGNDAISTFEGITISGGKITAKAYSLGQSISSNAISFWADDGIWGEMVISGGEIDAYAQGNDAIGIITDQELTISGGKIKSEATDIGIASEGLMTIGNGIISVAAKGNTDESGIYCNAGIVLGNELTIEKPANGKLKSDNKTIVDANGNHATDVLIVNKNQYTVTVNETENGSVVSNRTKANGGDTVILSISPDENYRLASISVKDADGNVVDVTETADGYEFTMPESNVMISAAFIRYYAIAVPEESAPFIELDQEKAAAGETVTVKRNDVPGYVIKSIKVTDPEGKGIEVSEDDTFTMPASEVTVTVEVAKLFTLTFDLDGGSYNGKPAYTVECEEGTVIKLPEPNKDGYVFAFWQGSRYYAGQSYTVTGDHRFKAIWNKISDTEYFRVPKTGIE